MRISETLMTSMNINSLIHGFLWECPQLLKPPPALGPRYRDWGASYVLGFFFFGTMFRNRTNWETKWGGSTLRPPAAVWAQRP
jgi:hypothetical protein